MYILSHLSRVVLLLNLSDVTVLLSLTVFLNTVSETMPNTSDAVPLIGSGLGQIANFN